MKLQKMYEVPRTRTVTDAFRGYNHNLRIADGEFYDMQNLTSDFYPILSPRKRRGKYADATHPNGLIAKDHLCYAAGTKFYINGLEVSGLTLTDSAKTLVSMGAYVIILPDKKYVNTVDVSEYGSIDRVYNSPDAGEEVQFQLCRENGVAYSPVQKGSTPPESQSSYWLDTSGDTVVLKQYSIDTGMWVSVGETYVNIFVSDGDLSNAFDLYDGVEIHGIANGEDVDPSIAKIDGNFVIVHKGSMNITIQCPIEVASATYTLNLSVRRSMPDMDFVIESENRLWGCKYGLVNGVYVNEIYASKLGDFKNWNCFMGISTDSYVASVGSDGAFTGAFTYLGYPIFFKEGCLHKVYGNFPSNFQIQTTACRGVQKGCGKSLAMVNETLFYKGKNGICGYDGSLPAEVSNVLGEEAYTNAVACSHGNKYYISMKDGSNKYNLFVFDVAKGLWHREDNTRVDAFCSCGNELYFIENGKSEISTMFGSGTVSAKNVKWFAESGIIAIEYPDRKYLSALNVRMQLDVGSSVSFFVQYDSSGYFEHIVTMQSQNLRSFTIPITPRRCDHMRIRIEGEGEAKIFSITKTIEQGSDSL